jgi:ribosomal-protein-alanine N-acetyltransferase
MPGCFGWIAWDGESPAGFALARDLGTECEILSLGVVPRRRRRGTACELLAAVIAEARRRDLGSVVLEVAVDNDAARCLYAKLGFNQVGIRPRYYRRRTGLADALILRLMSNRPACLS